MSAALTAGYEAGKNEGYDKGYSAGWEAGREAAAEWLVNEPVLDDLARSEDKVAGSVLI